MLFIGRAVVALDAHLVVARRRKFARRGGPELGVALRAILRLPGIGGNQQAQADAPGRHRLLAGDDVELAIDEFYKLLRDEVIAKRIAETDDKTRLESGRAS